jgi:Skp family chaperone for outer membrane proteins
MTRISRGAAVTVLVLAGTAFAQSAPAQTPPPQTPPVRPPQAPVPVAPKLAVPAVVLPFPADTKIGFINLQSVFSGSQVGQAGQKTLKDFTDSKSAEIGVKGKAIQTLNQEILQQSSVLSAAVLAGKKGELEKLQRDLEFTQQSAQADIDHLQQQILAGFQEKVLPIIEAIAKEKGLYAVLDVQNSGAAYVYPGLDLSPEVIKRLDAPKGSAV